MHNVESKLVTCSRLVSCFVPEKQIRGDLKAYRAIEMSLNNA